MDTHHFNVYDQQLERSIKELLRNSRKIHSESVEVEVSDGNVTLSGTLPDEQEHHRCVELVNLVDDIESLDDQISVG